jgi:hypothetical protein
VSAASSSGGNGGGGMLFSVARVAGPGAWREHGGRYGVRRAVIRWFLPVFFSVV